MRDPAADGRPALEALLARALGTAVAIATVQQLSGGASSATWLVQTDAGRHVDPADLHVWEVYGNLKWGISCLQLADDHVSGRVPGVERAAIGRRVSEVAADLTYLLAFGDL